MKRPFMTDKLRGLNSEKELKHLLELIFAGKIERLQEAKNGSGGVYRVEGYRRVNNGCYSLVLPNADVVEAFDRAWEEYESIPLIKALK